MLPSKYTRKHVRAHKINPTDSYDLSLHRIMNRIDAEKDAYYCSEPIKYNHKLFELCADELFGVLPEVTYNRSLEHLETSIKHYEAHNITETVVYDYTDKLSLLGITSNVIEYGIQDSGLSPQRYDKHIKTLITPGSYLDPASRSSANTYYGFTKVLLHRDFVNIGIPAIYTMSSILHSDKSCDITIELQGTQQIITRFSHSYIPISGNVLYFRGNSTKNKYIDSDTVNPIEASKFILCKELGDTMQAVYGKLCASEINNGDIRICLFTNDSILTLRCKLMNLQVIYNMSCGKREKTIHHYPTMSYITESYIRMWNKNIQLHNNALIQDIKDVLKAEKYYLVNGRIISFTHNESIKRALNKYITITSNSTLKFLALRAENMKPETYRRLSLAHQIPRLFIDNVLNTAALSLPYFTETDRNALIDSTRMSGGGSSALPEFVFPEAEDDYTVDREYTDADISSVKTKHTLYTMMYDKYKDRNMLCYIIDGISSLLYVFFGYIGMSTSNPEFLKHVIDAYDKNILGQISILDFERMFTAYLNTPEPESLTEERIVSPIVSEPLIRMRTVEPVHRRSTRRKKRDGQK